MTDRRERVILQLQDEFSAGMAKAAAQTAVLNEELKTLDGRTSEVDNAGKRLADDSGGLNQTSKKLDETKKSADQAGQGMGVLMTTVIGLGPALIPAAAGVVPVLTAMSAGMASLAGGAGVTVLAFKGMGTAIAAVNNAQLNPTTANINAAHRALANLAPAAAQFAQYIVSLEPTLTKMQQIAGQNLFPGLQAGIQGMLPVLPEINQLIANLAAEMGKLSTEFGQGIGGPQGQQFLHFLDGSAASTLDQFAHAFGNLAVGVASLFEAFGPLNTTFLHGLDDMTASFARWAQGLSQTNGFHEFVAYIEQEGPQVLQLLGTFTTTLLSVAEAFAPWGTILIPILTDVLKLIGALANSPLGPFIASAISIGVIGAKGFNLMQTGVESLTKSLVDLGIVAKTTTTAVAAEGEAAVVAGTENAAASAEASGGGILSAALASRGLKLGPQAGLLAAGGTTAGALLVASLLGQFTNGYGVNSANPSGALTDVNIQSLANNLKSLNPTSNLGVASSLFGSSILGGVGQSFGGFLGSATGSIEGLFGIHSPGSAERSGFASIDQQLAQMVQMGQSTQALDYFNQLTTAAAKQGATVDQVTALLPNYTNALSAISSAADGATGSIRAMTDAQHQNASAALQAFNAETSYGNAVQALRKQAAGGAGGGIDIFTKGGTANRSALSNFAASWNNESAAVQGNVKRYQEAANQMKTYAQQMGLSRKAIAEVVNWLDKPQAVFKNQAQQQTQFWSNILTGKGMNSSPKIWEMPSGIDSVFKAQLSNVSLKPNAMAPVVQAQSAAAQRIAAAQDAAAIKIAGSLIPELANIVNAVLAKQNLSVSIGGQTFDALVQAQALNVYNNVQSRTGGKGGPK